MAAGLEDLLADAGDLLVLSHALATLVTLAEVVLGPGIPAFRGLAKPLHRLRVILVHALALVKARGSDSTAFLGAADTIFVEQDPGGTLFRDEVG